MRKENELLRDKLAYFSTQMDSLLIKIRIMEEWEDNLRLERRLRVVSPDLRALGSGGEPFVDPAFLPFCLELHVSFNEVQQKLNYLTARTALTYETHFDLISSLQTRESLYRATPSIWPTFGRITSDFGYRLHPVFRYRTLHAGIDIANDRGTPIYATADGIVSFAGRSGASGNLIRIEHVSGLQTRYAHLDRIFINAGDSVSKGQIIATMGMSGVSTGYHLHYEVFNLTRRVTMNPNGFLNLSEDQIVVHN
jgi:murein DD-endopeptidase MepM/ murein hydrolase activator NlpD